MNREIVKRIVGSILLIALVAVFSHQSVIRFLDIPPAIVVFKGEEVHMPQSDFIKAEAVDEEEAIAAFKSDDGIHVAGLETGDSKLTFSAFGVPIKTAKVKVLDEFEVIPGGQSIGVQLNTLGVLVVGYHEVKGESGTNSPGEDAGIQIGDIVSEVNGQAISDMGSFADELQAVGKDTIDVKIIRDDVEKVVKVKLSKDAIDGSYKLGLYVRDSATGIGTLTFYDPASTRYGALGHVISDADTKSPIVVRDGTVYKSTITSIDKGESGNPGEKLARFSEDSQKIGTISANTPFGIFGKLTTPYEGEKAVPIALSKEVEKGSAEILTVVDGGEVERFSVEVVSTTPQKFPATKGMVVKITDKRLLEKTGGIVQGMSGSPIIQNGKLIGAVTHVFVNDPTSGYGVHIEWMLKDAGIDIYAGEHLQAG